MKFQLDGNEVYASTGGREPVEGQPWLIFMHGAGSSHLVWSQQSRSFAYGGYNVLAVDFPGHNLSGGAPLANVNEQADWIVKIMDALDIPAASFIGHSQGGLVALALAGLVPKRTSSLVLIATAAAIPVNDALLNMAENKQHRAKSAMTSWGLGPAAHHFDNSVPGVSQVATGLRTMDRNAERALPIDLNACNNFSNGLDIASNVTCPTLTLLAGKDKMTPLKFGKKLADALPDNRLHVFEKSGHTIPTERPIEVNAKMREFLAGIG